MHITETLPLVLFFPCLLFILESLAVWGLGLGLSQGLEIILSLSLPTLYTWKQGTCCAWYVGLQGATMPSVHPNRHHAQARMDPLSTVRWDLLLSFSRWKLICWLCLCPVTVAASTPYYYFKSCKHHRCAVWYYFLPQCFGPRLNFLRL